MCTLYGIIVVFKLNKNIQGNINLRFTQFAQSIFLCVFLEFILIFFLFFGMTVEIFFCLFFCNAVIILFLLVRFIDIILSGLIEIGINIALFILEHGIPALFIFGTTERFKFLGFFFNILFGYGKSNYFCIRACTLVIFIGINSSPTEFSRIEIACHITEYRQTVIRCRHLVIKELCRFLFLRNIHFKTCIKSGIGYFTISALWNSRYLYIETVECCHILTAYHDIILFVIGR